MFRGLMIGVAVLIAGGVLCLADERPPAPPTEPSKAAVANPDDSADVLEAQLAVKKAYVRAAEVGLAGAKGKLDQTAKARAAGTVSAEDLEQAKFDVETASAQLDIRTAEMRAVEVRLKQAKKPSAAGAPKVAAFKMPAVMREFHRAKYQVYLLNKQRTDLSGKLTKLRNDVLNVQQRAAKETDAEKKPALAEELLTLQRDFEGEERRVNTLLNDEASRMIGELYDQIKTVVDRTAKEKSYHIVFAYPDAVTQEEQDNVSLKELKLKPPAAQPFFVDDRVDITGIVSKRLNELYPALDARGEKVDVKKLPDVPVPSYRP